MSYFNFRNFCFAILLNFEDFIAPMPCPSVTSIPENPKNHIAFIKA